MPRALTAQMLAEIEKTEMRPVFFFELTASALTFRFWSGIRDITWNGETWLSTPTFKGIEGISESLNTEPSGLTAEWAGEQAVGALLNDLHYGDVCKYWLGFLDAAGNVIPDPILLFEGNLDTTELDDKKESSTVKLNFENVLIALNRQEELRYNSETQKRFHPLDEAFRFLAYLQNFSAFWGNRKKKRQRKRRKKS